MEKGVLRNDDIKFREEFKEKFKEAYNINPTRTLKYMQLCTSELGYEIEEEVLTKFKLKIFNFFKNEVKRVIFYCILLVICGLCSFEGFMFYFFGLLFFLAGVLLNLFNKEHSSIIVFLFSHGLVGLILMYVGFSIPVISYLVDSQIYLVMYICSIICGVCGFLRMIIYSLSSTNISNKSNVFIYFIFGFFMLAILNIFVFFRVG